MSEFSLDSKGKKCPGGYWIAAGKKCRGSSRTGRSIARAALAGGIIGAGAIGAAKVAKKTEKALLEAGAESATQAKEEGIQKWRAERDRKRLASRQRRLERRLRRLERRQAASNRRVKRGPRRMEASVRKAREKSTRSMGAPRREAKVDGSRVFSSPYLGDRLDAAAKGVLKGKKCGKGYIPKNHKCKAKGGTGSPRPSGSKIAAATVGAGLVGGIAVAAAFRIGRPSLLPDPPPSRKKTVSGNETAPPRGMGLGGPVTMSGTRPRSIDPDRIAKRYGEEVFSRGEKRKIPAINGIPVRSVEVDSYLKKPDNTSIDDGKMPEGTKVQKVGVVVVEPDGRLWMMEPLNHVGGKNNFAKGGVEEGLTLQQNALKEAREELGLDISIVDKVGDYDDKTGHYYRKGEKAGEKGRSDRTVRYYVGIRNGGAPWDAHWEADKVRLVPPDEAEKRFREGGDRREASVLEGLRRYTDREENRQKLIASYKEAERISRRREAWRPRMSLPQAISWTRRSGLKKDLYHLTNADAADKIQETGFRTDIIWRANYGKGVYAGQEKEDLAIYADKKGSELLTLKAAAEKPLVSNEVLEAAGIGDASEPLTPTGMKAIAIHLGMGQDYDRHFEYHKRLGSELRRRRRRGELTKPESRYLGLNTSPAAHAFSTVIQRAGYDSVTYKHRSGANHAIVFNPRDVTIVNRKTVTPEDLAGRRWQGDSTLSSIYPRLDALPKGKKCGKGYIPRARKCLKQMVRSGASASDRALEKNSGALVKASVGIAAGAIAGGAAIGAVAAYKEYGQMAIGRMQAGHRWTQKNPPGEPWVNKDGVVEFPEINGFSSFKRIARKETGDDTVYPFASGIMGLVFKSRKDDSYVLKVPKDFYGRTFSAKQARKEWKNLVVAERTGLTPKPLKFYKGSNSIKMENLMDTKRPGGIPAMLDKSYGEVDPNSIVSGFTRLHSTGVSHGDASASNLMVQKNGQLLFVDLGNKEIGDPEGTLNDLEQVRQHLRTIERVSGRRVSPSPHLEAMDLYMKSGGGEAAYMEYRERIRALHSDIH